MAEIPKRGDIIWITLDPQSGKEQMGRRPSLVLSPVAYNRLTGLVIICPITSRVKGYRFEVLLPSDLPVKGVVLADQVKSIDWNTRHAEWVCSTPDEVLEEVIAKLSTLLPLSG